MGTTVQFVKLADPKQRMLLMRSNLIKVGCHTSHSLLVKE
nr:MAG TPA: hypothetical protein [Caudoviricetes sp.]